MQITKRIRLDFARALSPIYVFAKQGDVDSRYVEVEPLENGKAYTIPEGVTAAFACKKPDGHQVLIDGATSESGYPKIDYENNLIILELTDQTLAAAGDAIATAILKDSITNKVLSTQNFILKIERSALEGASVESADEYQGYIAALNLIDEALKKSEDTVKEEEKRAESELERQLNEATRQEAEKERVETFSGWKEQIDGITADNAENRQNIAEMMTQITSNTQGITQNSQLISRNSARLTNVEQRISPSPFVKDSTVAYVKDVPENALPYAEVQKVGGMTRKCTNLLNLADTSIKSNGVTATVSNQKISLSGVATGSTWNIIGSVTLTAGSYMFSCLEGIKSNLSIYLYNTNQNISINKQSIVVTETSTFDVIIQVMDTENDASIFGDIHLMLNTGATALPYEPYFEGLRSAPVTSVDSAGANLIPFPYASGDDYIHSGITFHANADGSITANGTASSIAYFCLSGGFSSHKTPIPDWLKVGETYTINSNVSNVICQVFLYKADGSSRAFNGQFVMPSGYDYYGIFLAVSSGAVLQNVTAYPMLNKGTTALPYAPYTKSTLPVPEAVQALDGYGEGVNESVYNYITWNPEGNVKTYTKAVGVVDLGTLNWALSGGWFSAPFEPFKVYTNNALCTLYEPVLNTDRLVDKTFCKDRNGRMYIMDSAYTDAATFKAAMAGVMLYYELATPEVTDISDLITADNLIPVQGNGTITFVNEYGYDVPSTVEYMT